MKFFLPSKIVHALFVFFVLLSQTNAGPGSPFNSPEYKEKKELKEWRQQVLKTLRTIEFFLQDRQKSKKTPQKRTPFWERK